MQATRALKNRRGKTKLEKDWLEITSVTDDLFGLASNPRRDTHHDSSLPYVIKPH